MGKFYLTAAIPYVNAKPHVGHALEFVQVDVIKRFHKIKGDETLLLSGGDENALKNVQAAQEKGIPVQEFVGKNTKLYFELAKKLDVEFDVFQKGSDKKHHLASQKLWNLCFENGDIYKKTYKGLYCLGCELFYEKGELNENLECLEHPGKKLEEVSEENYFFKLSKYQKQIEELIESDTLKIIPESRKNEALTFVKQGLRDISVSRSNERAKNWGVQVPGDPTQRIYVWFDALNIYQSGIGFGWDEKLYNIWWPADLHVIGKGILRFHAIYWPAFLLSAKLKLPKSIFVHGYFTVNGQKMSKTLGNVIDPIDIINKYGVDALRYYLLKEIPSAGDGDFSEKRLVEVYNADLANGLGNLVARVAKLCEITKINYIGKSFPNIFEFEQNPEKYNKVLFRDYEKRYLDSLKNYLFDESLKALWTEIKTLDSEIQEVKPWEFEKANEDKKTIIKTFLIDASARITDIGFYLEPFLPETSKKIKEQFKGPKILSQKPLFPRI
ncbi:MAG: methionine--tRNA ligase [bacterium]|nr:methionine--tRNA ligase [bacterium]